MTLRFPRLAPVALALPLLLAACATAPTEGPPPMPDGTDIALGTPVASGTLVITPLALVEDSRCPMNARCVWAGRVVVTTRIEGRRWDDTADITLGEPYVTHGVAVTLLSVRPDQVTGRAIQPDEYRFIYTGG